jgi:hypothetical protein
VRAKVAAIISLGSVARRRHRRAIVGLVTGGDFVTGQTSSWTAG